MANDETGKLKGSKKLLDALMQDKAEEAGQEGPGRENSVAAAPNEAIELLKNRLAVKDRQIEALSAQVKQIVELDKDTNILLKSLHDKLALLEQSKREIVEPAAKILTDEKRDDQAELHRKDGKRLLVLVIALLITLGLFFYLNRALIYR